MNSISRKLFQMAILAAPAFCLPTMARASESKDAQNIMESVKHKNKWNAI